MYWSKVKVAMSTLIRRKLDIEFVGVGPGVITVNGCRDKRTMGMKEQTFKDERRCRKDRLFRLGKVGIAIRRKEEAMY